MDLNMLMRQTAENSLQARLDAAVADGDAEAARKVSKEIADFAVSFAPKGQPYTPQDVRAELAKTDWFGSDPKKSAKAMEFGKNMDLSRFATAADFAKAVVTAVEEDMKPVAAGEPDEEEDEEKEPGAEGETGKAKPKPAARRTDGPRDGDLNSSGTRQARGPWTKLSDAPADTQKEIKRQAAKHLPLNATDEQRKKFTATQLDVAYRSHQAANKGK